MWSWLHPRVCRRPLGWLLVLLALCSLQVHAFQRVAAADPMAGMDPDICFSMSLDHAAGGPAHCQHDCVCLHLNLLAPPMAEIGLPAAVRQFEYLTLAMDALGSPAWPSGQPRGPPRA